MPALHAVKGGSTQLFPEKGPDTLSENVSGPFILVCVPAQVIGYFALKKSRHCERSAAISWFGIHRLEIASLRSQ
jgi:hypothetical protein